MRAHGGGSAGPAGGDCDVEAMAQGPSKGDERRPVRCVARTGDHVSGPVEDAPLVIGGQLAASTGPVRRTFAQAPPQTFEPSWIAFQYLSASPPTAATICGHSSIMPLRQTARCASDISTTWPPALAVHREDVALEAADLGPELGAGDCCRVVNSAFLPLLRQLVERRLVDDDDAALVLVLHSW